MAVIPGAFVVVVVKAASPVPGVIAIGPVNVAPASAAPPRFASVVDAVPEPENESGPVNVAPEMAA